jgi:hypothetical protein
MRDEVQWCTALEKSPHLVTDDLRWACCISSRSNSTDTDSELSEDSDLLVIDAIGPIDAEDRGFHPIAQLGERFACAVDRSERLG